MRADERENDSREEPEKVEKLEYLEAGEDEAANVKGGGPRDQTTQTGGGPEDLR